MNIVIKKIVISLFLALLSLPLVTIGCKSVSSTIPITSDTSTIHIAAPPNDSQAVSTFLDNARSCYEAAISGKDNSIQPQINGMSASDFLSLKVQSDSIILINDKPYNYRVARIGHPKTLSIGLNLVNYAIDYTPLYGNTGSLPIKVTVHQDKNLVGEFTFQENGLILNSSPVFIEAYHVEDLLFLFIYYTPVSTASFESMWLVLLPVSP